MLVRTLDRLLTAGGAGTGELLAARLRGVGDRVSGRLLASAREQLANRDVPGLARLFANQSARGWSVPDSRPPLPREEVAAVVAALDDLLVRRLPVHDLLLVDRAVRSVAVPRSGRGTAKGMGVLPRGSRTEVQGDRLRFFVHWTQTRDGVTDLDLSVTLLDRDFAPIGQVSWTNLREGGIVHSGDLVTAPAPDGATEMIDLDLSALDDRVRHVVPQVLVYSGDGFGALPEAFFGYMTRDGEQGGMPFDPRTVRVRSDLEGASRVLVPLVFNRGGDRRWEARWTHLFLRGRRNFNRVEHTGASAGLMTRAVVERRHLTVGRLVDLMERTCGEVREYREPPTAEEVAGRRVAYLGLERPEGLPEGVGVTTLADLPSLLPDPGEVAAGKTR